MYTEEQMDKKNIIKELEELSAEELDKKLEEVPYYQRQVVMATLYGDEHTPDVIETWTALAQRLSSTWTVRPESRGTGVRVIMKGTDILRASTPAEIFDHLVENIRQKRSSANWKEKEDAKTAAEVLRLKEEVQRDIGKRAYGGLGDAYVPASELKEQPDLDDALGDDEKLYEDDRKRPPGEDE
jgi:hypothetical protein